MCWRIRDDRKKGRNCKRYKFRANFEENNNFRLKIAII